MFNKISQKLRHHRSGGSTGQRDKSFAYGKMQKPDDESLLSRDFNEAQDEKYFPAGAAAAAGGGGGGGEEAGGGEDQNREHEREKPDQEQGEQQQQQQQRDDVRTPSFSFAESVFPLSSTAEKQDSPAANQWSDAEEEENGSGESWSFDCTSSSKTSWGPSFSARHQEDISIGPAVLKDYEDTEEDFLGEFEEYFENLSVDKYRREQYPKLDEQRLVYLDYANCGIFSVYQVQEHMRVLLEEGPCLEMPQTGLDISHSVPDTQDRVFELLNANHSDYSMIFTTGFTAGFRLMGQAFPFQRNSPLLICQDNHKAVQRLIDAATDKRARILLAPILEADLTMNGTELRRILGRRDRASGGPGGLFVFPVQACASGILHSLNWILEAQQNGWQVLIDTSTYLPTGSLDLSIYQPDFVLGSISHLLGYPSGFGFLLVRKAAFKIRIAGSDNVNIRFMAASASSSEGVRDGEVNCLIWDEDSVLNAMAFSVVAAGLARMAMMGHDVIRKRVGSIVTWLLRTLLSLRHKEESGLPLTRVYGPLSTRNRGNVIAFSILDGTGSEIPVGLVRRLAEQSNIFMSGGHLSSPGVINLMGKASERIRDASVFERNYGKLALLRVSVGPVTNLQDVYRFAQFVSRFRDEDYLKRGRSVL